MPLLSSYGGGIFSVNYVTIMLQHKSERGFFFLLSSSQLLLCLLRSALCAQTALATAAGSLTEWRGGGGGGTDRPTDRPTSGGRRRRRSRRSNCHGNKLTSAAVSPEPLMSSNMKYKKFITIMQAALGVAPLNKRELIPPPRKLWKPARWVLHVCVSVCVCLFMCVLGLFAHWMLELGGSGADWVVAKSMQNQREST